MFSLTDVVERTSPPTPWAEGDNIPWDDPEFSSRMLAEHLSQDHDLASRRVALIDEQVATLVAELLPPAPARILDLVCGPGLYLSRLTALGYAGTGIDFSPASIDHAVSQARDTEHDIEYRLEDLRTCRIAGRYDAALLLYGQLNVFRRSEAPSLLAKTHAALDSGGVLVLEPQTFGHIETAGQAPPTWSSHQAGLFSADPHLLLMESYWDKQRAVSTQRFYVVDAETGSVARHALSNEAYTEKELVDLLASTGFVDIEYRPSLTGDSANDGLRALVGTKR